MAERAHPDDSGFNHFGWRIKLRRGIVPWLYPPRKNPYREAFDWRYEWAASFCQGKRVVDVPCGMGWGTSLMTGAQTLTGIDIDPESIAEAKQRYGDKATFRVGSMAALPFAENSIDVVVCLEGIEHVPVDVGDEFLKEAARVLTPEGRLLLSSPFCTKGGHSGNPYHVHEYQPEEIRGKLGKRFRIASEVERKVGPLTVLYFECLRSEGTGEVN